MKRYKQFGTALALWVTLAATLSISSAPRVGSARPGDLAPVEVSPDTNIVVNVSTLTTTVLGAETEASLFNSTNDNTDSPTFTTGPTGFGAEINPTGNPIGGGVGYSHIIDPVQADYTVTTKSELLFALADAQAYARDSWGNNSGMINGASWVNGKIGKAMHLDGVNDYIDYLNPSGLKSPGGTLAFWIKPAALISDTDVVNVFEDGYQNYLLIRLVHDKIYVRVEDDDLEKISLTSSRAITTTNYHYIAVTQDGSGIKIFIDGELSTATGVNSGYWTNHLNVIGLWLGGGHWGNFKGDLDEVTLYSKALTATEVEQNYAGASIVTDGLVSWWRFENNPALTRKIVYVADNAEIDLTGEKDIAIPISVTLASGRGHNGSLGGLIYTSQYYTDVLPLLRASGPGVRVTGLRLRGPDPEIGDESYTTDYFLAQGIASTFPSFEVDNSELWGWSDAAIVVDKGNTDAYVHHNSIHHNRREGLGYGVVIGHADQNAPINALIEANLFDYCRHAIASTGSTYSSYEARYNLALEHANGHSFDRHGTEIPGHWWGGDAGDRTIIHHNTARVTDANAVGIRGTPRIGAEIYDNWFYQPDQVHAILLYTTTNVVVGANHYGAEPPSGTILPVPHASAQPTFGKVPLTVSFDGFHSYDPNGALVAYQWDFGDGTTASGIQVTHTFTTVGRYHVELTVSDNDGIPMKDSLPIAVAPTSGNYVLDFWVKDSYRSSLAGYYRKQALIDGTVVWEDDVAGDEGWTHVVTDVSALVGSQSEVTVTLQTYCDKAVTDPAHEIIEVDTYWDDVNLWGSHISNGDMETSGSWNYSESGDSWAGATRSGEVRSGDRAYLLEYPYEITSTAGSWAKIEQSATIISSTLRGQWEFEQIAGATTPDTSIYSNHGTLINMNADNAVEGPIGQALRFDGVDDYVDAGNDVSLKSPVGTIEFWLTPQTTGEMDILRLFEDDAQNYLLIAKGSTDQLRVIIEEAGVAHVDVTSTLAISDTHYHHVAVTQDGSGVKIFIDGKESATTGVNSAYWSNHLTLGRLQIGRGQHGYFNGILDNVAIYSRALSSDEIYRHNDAGYPRGRWPLDEGSGNTTADMSNYGNHGTLVNMDAGNWVNGVSGKALRFDGVNDYVDFGSQPSLKITDTLTIELWSKFDTFTTNEYLLSNNLYSIFHRGDWAGDRLYFLYHIVENESPGDSAWNYWAGVRTETELVPGRWYHIVGVKTGNRMSIYLNGVLEKEFNCLSGYTIDSSPMSRLYLGKNPFKGALDEITLYPRAMSADEVRQRYNQGRPDYRIFLPIVSRAIY